MFSKINLKFFMNFRLNERFFFYLLDLIFVFGSSPIKNEANVSFKYKKNSLVSI